MDTHIVKHCPKCGEGIERRGEMKWYGLYNIKTGGWMHNAEGDIKWGPRSVIEVSYRLLDEKDKKRWEIKEF